MAMKDRRQALAQMVSMTATGLVMSAGVGKAQAALTHGGNATVKSAAGGLGQASAPWNEAPRRRTFKTVPMILTSPDEWDHEALSALLARHTGPRQVWNNTDIAGPWLNVMRNSMNAQLHSFRHSDYLSVSATHGSAHLGLFDDAAWDKYKLADQTAGKFKTNSVLGRTAPSAGDVSESANGGNSIRALHRRGVVFLACHNAIWELAGKLIAAGINPDKAPVDAVAADLTNHVIPEAIVTPGVVATILELQQAGFHYCA